MDFNASPTRSPDTNGALSNAKSPARSRRAQSVQYCALAVVSLAAVAAIGPLRPLLFENNFHTVIAGQVYRSAQPSADFLRQRVATERIRSVINLRGEWEKDSWYQQERAATTELGLAQYDVFLFTHRQAPLAEVRKLLEAFDQCPKPVLLHCRRGADRTGLAAALYMVLFENQTPEEAMSQYSVRCGHLPCARGSRLPHLFDCYRDWLAQQGRTHSPAELRRWIQTENVIGYFGAKIAAQCPATLAVGERASVLFEVTNISQRPWMTRQLTGLDVHLMLTQKLAGVDSKTETRIAIDAPAVAPGTTIRIPATIGPLATAGSYDLLADLRDADDLRFLEMGVGGWHATVVVGELPDDKVTR